MIEALKRPEIRAFLQAHANEDPAALVFKYRNDPTFPIQAVAAQIAARQKAKKKLPTFFGNPDIIFPTTVSMEQCSSEATALYKSSIFQGKTLTDLTGGFGVDCYFLSRKFDQSHYIEQNAELKEVVQYNFDLLGAKIACHNLTAEDYLEHETNPTTHYFIDPARRDGGNNKVFRIEDCQPNLKEILPKLLSRKSEILIKLSPLLDITQALNALPNVAKVHVVAVQNECKELLFKIEPDFDGHPKIIAINIRSEQTDALAFYESEQKKLPNFGLPLAYLYEPNAAIMKSGGFNAVANQLGLTKLHANSHLYTSELFVKDFPGRAFQITTILPLNKKKLKSVLTRNKANITVRNFPATVKFIRQKTGIQEGGDAYLFATTLIDESLKVLVCERLKQ